jgi:hypothetical protein
MPVKFEISDKWRYRDEAKKVTSFLCRQWHKDKRKIEEAVLISLYPMKSGLWRYRHYPQEEKDLDSYHVSCYLGYKTYPITYKELHKIGMVDPVTARLSGKMFIRQREEIEVQDVSEDLLMLLSRASWFWLRSLDIVPGRKGKCGGNRYAASMLELWRKRHAKKEEA